MNERALAKQVNKPNTELAVKRESAGIANIVMNEIQTLAGINDMFRYRLPRLGKIHLGIKAKTQSGKEYPKATDYFVLPDLLLQDQVFMEKLAEFNDSPDKPTRIPVMLPCNSVSDNLRSSFDFYGSTRGLKCRSYDGVTAQCVDEKTGEMHPRECLNVNCPDYKSGHCQVMTRLRAMLPDAAGIGIWQIDTKSANNRANIATELVMVQRALGGQIAGIPFMLTLESQEFVVPMTDYKTKETKATKTTCWLMHLRTTLNLSGLQEARKQAIAYESGDVEGFDDTIDDEPFNSADSDDFEVGEPPAEEYHDAEFKASEDTNDSHAVMVGLCNELGAKLFESETLFNNFCTKTFKKNVKSTELDQIDNEQLQTLYEALNAEYNKRKQD